MCQGLTHFFSPKWLWKTWRSYDRPPISLHTCFVLQKAVSLMRCQLLRKIRFCFQLGKWGLVKLSLQPPVALFQSSCPWRCIHRSPTCKFFRCIGVGASSFGTAGFSRLGHMLQSWCTKCHIQTENVAVLWCLVMPLSWQSILAGMIQGYHFRMHYEEERAFSTGISLGKLLWTDS